MGFQLGVDFSQVPQYEGGGEPVPAGWYNVFMSKSEQVPTNDSATTGHWMGKFEYTIMDGQYKGRKLFDQLNLGHSNPTTREIAYKKMSSVSHSCGRPQFGVTDELHNIPLKVRVKIKAGGQKKDPMGNVVGQYEAQNEIADYKPASYTPQSPTAAPNMSGGPNPQMPQGATSFGAPAFNAQPQPQVPFNSAFPQAGSQPQMPFQQPQGFPQQGAPAFAQPGNPAMSPQMAGAQQFPQQTPAASFQNPAGPATAGFPNQQPMQQVPAGFPQQQPQQFQQPTQFAQPTQPVQGQPQWASADPTAGQQPQVAQQQQQQVQQTPAAAMPGNQPVPPWLAGGQTAQ